MGMKLDGLANFGKALVALQADLPEIMDHLAVGEGRFARDQARKICTEENIINTGDYRLYCVGAGAADSFNACVEIYAQKTKKHPRGAIN